MLEDVIHHQPPQQFPIEDISSPLSAQLFELCDPELFPDTIQNSEVTSCSNCCYEDYSNSTDLSLPQDAQNFSAFLEEDHGNTNTTVTTPTTNSNATTATTAATANNNNGNQSAIFDSPDDIDNDISASIDFTPSPPFSVPPFLCAQQDQLVDFSSTPPLQNQISMSSGIDGPLTNSIDGLPSFTNEMVGSVIGGPPLISSIFEEECLSTMPSYVPLSNSSASCSFLGPNVRTYIPGTLNTSVSAADRSGIFTTSTMLMNADLPTQEVDYQADNCGIYCPDSMQLLNTQDIQAICAESQNLISTHASSTPFTADISNLEDSTFKVGKLSAEQRKEKIHRYMKKRNERNFSKKIKYACRKTLADSRPRVRGRFAKNDEFGENPRLECSTHEEDDKDEVVVKGGDMIDSSDIFAPISGVNSFKCNYPIQSWI